MLFTCTGVVGDNFDAMGLEDFGEGEIGSWLVKGGGNQDDMLHVVFFYELLRVNLDNGMCPEGR